MTSVVASSIDDVLGPSEKRFFGSGYRRVHYDVKDVSVAASEFGEVQAEAVVGLSYPADWSKKKDGEARRPHFSTVDALVLSAELAELSVAKAHNFRFDSDELARSWIRKVLISAGAKPQEDLTGIKAVIRRKSAPKPAPGEKYSVSSFDCLIGTMRVRMEIAHPGSSLVIGQWSYQDRSEALCPPAQRYYGDGFKAGSHEITDVKVDLSPPSAEGRLRVLSAEGAGAAARHGLEAAYGRSASLVDLLVAVSQLTQAVLYDFDGVRRENSDTLWMRRTSMVAEGPPRPCAEDGIAFDVALVDPGRLVHGEDVWSTANVVSEVAGVALGAAIAHRIARAAEGNGQ